MPVEVKTMVEILKKNEMMPVNEKTFTMGRSLEKAIVIDIAEGYVRMEYMLAELFLRGKEHEFAIQFLIEKDEKKYDKLVYDVTESDGTVHQEEFYFDITVGFRSICAR
ncbi:MAG: hypothetical protein IJK19_06325 [Bacteroidales bacterium]|nr:hypothetical protein [Bacteroidales bacterium]